MKVFIAVLAAGGILLAVFFGVQAHQRSEQNKKCELARHTAVVSQELGYDYQMPRECT
jgi:hypothetical protein